MEHMKNESLNTNTNMNSINQSEQGFELLAPAGSFEIFKAVIAAGADAVYVGGDMFGARAYANNFTSEELLCAIDYAHLHGVKVYLTVNTLLKNVELEHKLYDYLLPFYERGLDAVLVQDMGVLSYIRNVFPNLPIHTSTQMTVTGTDGVKLLQQMGVERVVMARELSLNEMKRIHDETGMELEAFVHGALCYCYSGQCLLSSMLGGRSGNRGRCAQPCRLSYSVLDQNRKPYQKESYVLSLKDMCGISDLNQLWEAGVYSLKIEGRMKQAAYAAGVVSYYRKYIDLFLADKKHNSVTVGKEDMQAVSDLGNRCGFTDAYYTRQNGADMVTFRKPSYAKTNDSLQNKVLESYVLQEKKIPLKGELNLSVGQPAVYRVSCPNGFAEVRGMEVMPAQQKPLVREEVSARMEKTKDTPFVMDSITITMDDNVFLPVKALNTLRREAIGQLQEQMLASYRRTGVKKDVSFLSATSVKNGDRREEKPTYSCLIENRSLLKVVLNKDWMKRVYIDLLAYRLNSFPDELKEDIAGIHGAGQEVYIALPRIFRARVSDWMRQHEDDLAQLPIDGVLVRNYEELFYVRKHWNNLPIVIDHNLYTYNDRASEAFTRFGVCKNTVPLELNRKEIKHRDNAGSAMVVYGYYPLMTTAPCVHANTAGCDKEPGLCFLKDRYRAEFPVKNYCDACYNVVFNSLPVMLFANMDDMRKAGIEEFRVDFTVESETETAQVLNLMEKFITGRLSSYPPEWENHYTNGHYKRGVE